MNKWILIDRTHAGKASAIAAERLRSALAAAKIDYEKKITWTGSFEGPTILMALNCDPLVRNIAKETITAPESIQMFRHGDGVILSGSDERGLAYAVMEMAERVEAYGEEALLTLTCETHSPSVAIRGIDKLVVNTADEAWWMSEDYWRYYLLKMLAARYNRIVLLVGFDTSYFSPPYPYFVEVPEYPAVHVNDPNIDRATYAEALRRLGRLAHEYGMDFTFATWQQTNWLASQVSKVDGIEDLMLYCSAGIREMTLQFPEIDTIQLRVNHEAGVGTQVTAEEYWYKQLDGFAEGIRRGAKTKLEMRAKGLTDPMIRYAKELGIDLTVSTKYWCEQAGLPHHLTRMRTEELVRLDNFNHSRRYSYADMLKKPRMHKFVYRLWNDGSTDIFTWGDPDYVRRFVKSMDLGNADGFEIMPMLSLKGGPQDGMYTGWNLFDDPAYQPQGYEDSRYWLCDRLFGRIGYNIGECDEAWMRPMKASFGAAADAMMAAVSAGSKLIPFIVGYHMPVHPQLQYWAEFSTGGALFVENNYNPSIKRSNVTYQNTEPGDAGLFYPVNEYAKDHIAGKEDGRYTPWQIAGTLRAVSENVGKYLAIAEEAGIPDSNEARGAVLDMKMLGIFALYHRDKIIAALKLCLYEETGDKAHLAQSLSLMKSARARWQEFATLGQKYHKRLLFYVGNPSVCRDGNWTDFYPELDADVEKLTEMLGEAPGAHGCPFIKTEIASTSWRSDVPACVKAGEALDITLTTGPQDSFRGSVALRYRHTNQLDGKFLRMPMQLRGGAWHAQIPAQYITPEWDLLIYFEAVSQTGEGMLHPGLWHTGHMLPYHIVEVEG